MEGVFLWTKVPNITCIKTYRPGPAVRSTWAWLGRCGLENLRLLSGLWICACCRGLRMRMQGQGQGMNCPSRQQGRPLWRRSRNLFPRRPWRCGSQGMWRLRYGWLTAWALWCPALRVTWRMMRSGWWRHPGLTMRCPLHRRRSWGRKRLLRIIPLSESWWPVTGLLGIFPGTIT